MIQSCIALLLLSACMMETAHSTVNRLQKSTMEPFSASLGVTIIITNITFHMNLLSPCANNLQSVVFRFLTVLSSACTSKQHDNL